MPSYGVVIRATNELKLGKGFLFTSTAHKDILKDPYVLVPTLCIEVIVSLLLSQLALVVLNDVRL